jgi:hypothetical protein
MIAFAGGQIKAAGVKNTQKKYMAGGTNISLTV